MTDRESLKRTGQDEVFLAEATTEQGEVSVISPSVEELLQDGETVLLISRPSTWFILIDGGWAYLFMITVALFFAWLGHQVWAPINVPETQVFPALAAAITIRLIWKLLDWANRIYVLTDRRIIVRRGVFQFSMIEAPLNRIQHSAIFTRLIERLLGMGTVGFATAGSGTFEVVWEMVQRPISVHRIVNEAIERYGRGGPTI